ncbi:unnamed protein product [Meloidogyne enterolobii]|uniref:Uncharacterized protein n=1 Tax=Meloidogyne enterolobii TaxID=390850 RepID=A0ACB1ABN5_MELEN
MPNYFLPPRKSTLEIFPFPEDPILSFLHFSFLLIFWDRLIIAIIDFSLVGVSTHCIPIILLNTVHAFFFYFYERVSSKLMF